MLLITVDTNQMDSDRVSRLREVTYVEHEIACITVSSRERGTVENVVFSSLPETAVWGESRWDEAVWGPTLAEPFVIGESPLDSGVLGSEESVEVFETALRIISGRSFPALGLRENLTNGQLRQLRDAMIFDAHVRERRDVLITDDAKGFVNGGRREVLEALGRTRILTWSEYEALAGERRLEELLPPSNPD